MARLTLQDFEQRHARLVHPQIKCSVATPPQAKAAIRGMRRVQSQLETLRRSIEKAEARLGEASESRNSDLLLLLFGEVTEWLKLLWGQSLAQVHFEDLAAVHREILASSENGKRIICELEDYIQSTERGPAIECVLPESVARSVQLLDTGDAEESDLEEAILDVLATGGPGGRTAKNIAYRLRKEGYLDIRASDINRCLHRSDAEIERSDESPPRWRFI